MLLRQLANVWEKQLSSIFISHCTSKPIPDEKLKCEHKTINILEGNKNKHLHNFPVEKDILSIELKGDNHKGKI